MEISVTVSFWFMLSRCLTFVLGKMILGERLSKRSENRNMNHYDGLYDLNQHRDWRAGR